MERMNSVTIIAKKRDGDELSEREIRYFVENYVAGDIPDYQAAAWCMAIFLKGMSREETIALTMAMAESGKMIDLSDDIPFAVDKHSSGGVGDKTSLIVLPLVAANGVPVAKMSGRGLAYTGGTLDKMESISGFSSDIPPERFKTLIAENGIVLAGQTSNLAPADGLLYALRDVTGTVSSKPLIASSIMSKKIAGGADGIVLDVKAGSGAFMQTPADAHDLARIMVNIGEGVGRKVTAIISDMNQPLGYAVGNAIEVKEAVATLQGGGPPDLREHCIVLAGHMLRLAGEATEKDLSDVRPTLEAQLDDGRAFEVFKRMVDAQGGDVSEVEDLDKLPQAPIIREIESERDGYLRQVDAKKIGLCALDLGAGRRKKGDPVDHGVGVEAHAKVGERITTGDRLFTVHARSEDDFEHAKNQLLNALEWSDRPGLPLFYGVVSTED